MPYRYERYLTFAQKMAYSLGDETRVHFGRVSQVDKKLRTDIVTEVDFENEKKLIAKIQDEFPDHAVLTEEIGHAGAKDAEWVWIIDPIDGTVNYAAGLPIFNISIALTYKGSVVVGVVYDPISREIYHAAKGYGSCVDNGRSMNCRLGPTSNKVLKDILVYIGISTHDSPEVLDQSLKLWREFHPRVRGVRMLGSMGLAIIQVGLGIFDTMIKVKADNFGTAAASLIATEAGAIFSAFDGKPWHLNLPNYIVANPHIYQQVKEIITKTLKI